MVQAPSEFDLADALDRLKAAIDKDLEKGPKPNEFMEKISLTMTFQKKTTNRYIFYKSKLICPLTEKWSVWSIGTRLHGWILRT